MTGIDMSTVKRDILVSLVFILLGFFAIVTINMGEAGQIADTATLTHATLPTIYGSLMIFLAGIIFIGALRKIVTGKRGSEQESINSESEKVKVEASPGTIMLRTWGTLTMVFAYAFLLAHVNFIVLTAGFLSTLFVLFGRRRPLKIVLASVIGSVGFYLLFIFFLKLPI